MKRLHMLYPTSLLGLSLMLGTHPPATAQSGAPNLIQFYGRRVDPFRRSQFRRVFLVPRPA